MKKTVLPVIAVLLLLALTACGGSDKKDAKPDLDAQEKKVATNLAKSFSGNSQALSKEEADCFAQGFVEAAGVKDLKDAKLIDAKDEVDQTNATFTTKLATQFAESFLGCVDYQKKQAEVIAKSKPTIDQDKLESCLQKQLPESYVTKLIVAGYTASPDSAKLLQQSQQKLATCEKQATKKKK